MSKKASFKKSFGLLILSISLILGVRWILFEPYVIPSGSMIPTLLINDHIVVSKYSFGFRWPFSSRWLIKPTLPERGDVVVFRSLDDDNYYLIKRVIGLPGDTVDFTEEGTLRINGVALNSRMVGETPQWAELDLGADAESFQFMEEQMGDRVYHSILERNDFRSVEASHLVPEGKIYLMGDNRDHSKDSRFWGELPIVNLLGRASFVWLSCEQTLSQVNFICDPRYIRWHRFFHRIQ